MPAGRSASVGVAGPFARLGSALPIAVATVVLFAVSPLVAPGSLQSSALATMLPFAAILAIVAVGQTLVIQQGGLDFSAPATISLSAVLLTKIAGEDAGRTFEAIVIVLAIAVAIGAVSGTMVTRLGVTPLIATLGVNALVLGIVQQTSGGLSLLPAPRALNDLALGKTLGVFNLVIGAGLLVAICSLTIKKTVVGRRFEAVGANAAAAHVAGISVNRYKLAAYVAASLTYAIAGLMLASFLRTPGLDIGNSYLLSSIAAVVVGGTALSGGAGSAVASAIGALFLTQLSQLLLAAGAETSLNFLVQGVAIGASMAIRTGVQQWRAARGRVRARAAGELAHAAAEDDDRAAPALLGREPAQATGGLEQQS